MKLTFPGSAFVSLRLPPVANWQPPQPGMPYQWTSLRFEPVRRLEVLN